MSAKTLPGGTFTLAEGLTVTRMGYGAMQLAGPGVFGPPKDRDAAMAVLREAVELGITHIDTSDYYGPHITNQIIREALHPYPDELRIVTKVGALRDAEGGWPHALSPEQLRQAVHDNLDRLGLDALDVVNLRVGGFDSPEPGSLAEPFGALAQLQQEGLIKHLGVSTVCPEQIAEAQSIAPIVCVQNFYNIAKPGRRRQRCARKRGACQHGLSFSYRSGEASVYFYPLEGGPWAYRLTLHTLVRVLVKVRPPAKAKRARARGKSTPGRPAGAGQPALT